MNINSIVLILVLGSSFLLLWNLETNKQVDDNFIHQFQKFKENFRKKYINEAEQLYRKTIFMQNWIKIQKHNLDLSNSHQLKITQFTDLTEKQFVDKILGTQVPKRNTTVEPISIKKIIKTALKPLRRESFTQIDWSARGNVTPVKNQGMCGSCWAFSAAGAIQSTYSILKKFNVTLSEQQLVDCSQDYGNHGCNGGWMDYAFKYVKENGLTTSSNYPYTGRSSTKCQVEKGEFKISGYVDVQDCHQLLNALQQRPVSVAVDASTWALYSSGILKICGNNVNHGVLLVGVDQNAWKIKNSWGVNWGQNGYIRIARGNTCGVCQYPSYPFL